MRQASGGCGCGCGGGKVPVLKFNISTKNITRAGQVSIGNRVNSISVKNVGTTIVMFQDKEPIQPGASKTFGGNVGEEYVGDLQISFQTQVPPPATILNSAWVTIKYYV